MVFSIKQNFTIGEAYKYPLNSPPTFFITVETQDRVGKSRRVKMNIIYFIKKKKILNFLIKI
jgi:hypothetical protein